MRFIQLHLILFLFLFSAMKKDVSAQVTVMTYNIRYENQWDTGSISWINRKGFILGSLFYHKADIIGMQEVLHSQLLYFDSALTGFDHVGAGREDGKEKGEYAPIFFNHHHFERIQDSTFWLSPTPSEVSKGWDAALERICTWVKLKDKRTGKMLYVFNTHFDHVGSKAREESAKLILGAISRIAGEQPVVLTGDFNTPENTGPIQVITGKSGAREFFLYDAMHRSRLPHHGSYKTFCGFRVRDGIVGDRIDYIFVSKDFDVLSHATLTDFSGDHFPSDHFPVITQLEIR